MKTFAAWLALAFGVLFAITVVGLVTSLLAELRGEAAET